MKFFDKIDLPIRMRIIYNLKKCYAIHFKFGEKVLRSLNKLVFVAKDSICSLFKENLLLYCSKFSAFVIAIINFTIELLAF